MKVVVQYNNNTIGDFDFMVKVIKCLSHPKEFHWCVLKLNMLCSVVCHIFIHFMHPLGRIKCIQ